MKLVTKSRRITSTELKGIVRDLDKWASGELGSKLTWKTLEDRFGFSRQSLQAKPEIKVAYRQAKLSLSGGLVKSRKESAQEVDSLSRLIEVLKSSLDDYKKREISWKQRWQRIAFHIREQNIQMSDIDKPVVFNHTPLSESETEKILKPFDKDIPPTGRV